MDLEWHRCKYDSKGVDRLKIDNALINAKITSLYFIHSFTRVLGKDITVHIAKMIYNTRNNTSLWFRRFQTVPKKKRKPPNFISEINFGLENYIEN